MDASSKIEEMLGKISESTGIVYLGKEYSTNELRDDLEEVKELLPKRWQFIVHEGREIRRFVKDVPGEVLAHFNGMVERHEQGRIEYLRTALADDRIRGHALTMCELE